LLVLGNAALHNEVTAALAAGISLRRLVRVPVFIAAAFAVAVFAMQNTVGAAANREVARLEARYFPAVKLGKRRGVSWPHLQNGWSCHILKFNRRALTGEKVLMHSFRPDAIEQILARRIYWDQGRRQWIIEDGGWIVLDPQQDWQGPVNRVTQQPAPMTEAPEDLFALDEPANTKPVTQLAEDIRRAERRGMPVHASWAEFHALFSQSALCFIMIWLAIPFALRLRHGGLAIGVGASVGIGVIYLVLFRVSMSLGYAEHLPPVAAAWLPSIFFLVIGLVLFWKTPT
jgi:lipopolysaccharide export system permease protein